MFVVYKITNQINNKAYIGSSIRYIKRWEQHINAAQNPNAPSYNYPLQRAFRKYGIDNFKFEILSSLFNNAYDMEEYEKQMIIQYDSLNNGYNQTINTHCSLQDEKLKTMVLEKISQKCAKVDLNENIIEIYTSYNDAARKNNLDGRASDIRGVCKGFRSSCNGMYFRDIDENNCIISKPFKRYKSSKYIVGIPLDDEKEEIYFNSILEASNLLNISRQSIGKCIKGDSRYTNVNGYIWREIDFQGNIINNNYDIDELKQTYNKTHPLINGERKTVTEWCRYFNISRQSVYKRIENGMDIIQAITMPKKG